MTRTQTFIGKYCCPLNIIDYEKKQIQTRARVYGKQGTYNVIK